ncbi:MAG: hypothetical protein K2W96_20200 [Gemmataceae bacterium]|nr:hypothetical protein [Gemmataceae bacterium]
MRPWWIGPAGFPKAWGAEWLRLFRGLADRLSPWPRCLGAALLLGVLPVLADWATGVRTSHVVTGVLGTPLLLAAAARERAWPALWCLVLAVLAHCTAVATLAAHDPERLALAMPKGEEYWQETVAWLRTGEGGVYDTANWLPFHVMLALLMAAWGYVSLGLVPLVEGLTQLDLMNFYVGRYLAHAEPGPAVVLAWHPWSVVRGIGFLFLVYELASFSLERLTGERLSPPSARWRRLGTGVGLLALDCVVKWAWSEEARRLLAGQLAT